MAEAARVLTDTAAYLSPTREFDEPHLEESDWPPDLDGPETLRMTGHLADIVHEASRCLIGIGSQHAIPDAAKPEHDAVADLLARAGRKLSALPGIPGQETGAASTAAAGTKVPALPAARRRAATAARARQAQPGTREARGR
jgi:hypothetical protein